MVMGFVHAFALVREDISRANTREHVRQLEQLAAAEHLALRDEVLVVSDASRYGPLLAALWDVGVETLLIPSVVHVPGWLAAIRSRAEILTLDPQRRWPRLYAPSTEAIPR